MTKVAPVTCLPCMFKPDKVTNIFEDVTRLVILVDVKSTLIIDTAEKLVASPYPLNPKLTMYVPNPLGNVVRVVAVLVAAVAPPDAVLNLPAFNSAVFEISPAETVVPTNNVPAEVIRIRSVPSLKNVKAPLVF